MGACTAALAVAAAGVARRGAPRGAVRRPGVDARRDLRRRLRRAGLGGRREGAHAGHREDRDRRDDGRHVAQALQGAVAMRDVVADAGTSPWCRRGHAITFGIAGRSQLRIA
jgi:hypothetical protein